MPLIVNRHYNFCKFRSLKLDKVEGMGVQTGDHNCNIYSFQLANDEVLLSNDNQATDYMNRKQVDECKT